MNSLFSVFIKIHSSRDGNDYRVDDFLLSCMSMPKNVQTFCFALHLEAVGESRVKHSDFGQSVVNPNLYF